MIAYVVEALGVAAAIPVHSEQRGTPEPRADVPVPADDAAVSTELPIDIRSLKEQKEPRSANEMAALVAYYVSELLPPDEQRTVITAADIEKYFKQANYRLPGRVAQALPDAARAGYFDAVDRGQYRLNPVGYNLVAHGMPSRAADASGARPARSRKRAATKTAAPLTQSSPSSPAADHRPRELRSGGPARPSDTKRRYRAETPSEFAGSPALPHVAASQFGAQAGRPATRPAAPQATRRRLAPAMPNAEYGALAL